MAQDIVIGGRLHSAATGNTVAGANEILDDAKGKKQNVINQEVDNEIGSDSEAGTIKGRIKSLETAVGSGGSVDERIAETKAEIIGDAAADYNTLGKVEDKIQETKSEILGDAASDYNTLGKVEDKIQAETSRAEAAEGALDNAKANKATTLEGYGIIDAYTKNETYTKTEVNGLVDTPHQNYVTVLTYAALIAIDPGSADTIYRVSNYDGSVPQVDVTKYSEYAWDGTQYVFLCVKSQIDEVFDISVYNNNATYADLAAALGTDGANVPQTLRRGGMSVKFVHSVDNKYVQYRLMSQTFSTTVTDWQGVDDKPTAGSNNLAESGGILEAVAGKVFSMDGKGSAGVFIKMRLVGARIYRIIPIKYDWTYSSTGTVLQFDAYVNGSYQTPDFYESSVANIKDFYDVTTVAADYYRLFIRADEGSAAQFAVIDITESNEINKNVNLINESIGSKVEEIAMSDGWIPTNGNSVDISDIRSHTPQYYHSIVSCQEGDIFLINGKGGDTDRLWCFVDSNYNVISVANGSATGNNTRIVAPTDAAYLIINDEGTGEKSYIGESISDSVWNDIEYAWANTSYGIIENGMSLYIGQLLLIYRNIAVVNKNISQTYYFTSGCYLIYRPSSDGLMQVTTANLKKYDVILLDYDTTNGFIGGLLLGEYVTKSKLGAYPIVCAADGVSLDGNTVSWNSMSFKLPNGKTTDVASGNISISNTQGVVLRDGAVTLVISFSSYRSSDILLLYKRDGVFIGGILLPYIQNFSNENIIIAANDVISNDNRVSWAGLTIRKKDGSTIDVQGSTVIVRNTQSLVLRGNETAIIYSLSGIKANDILLLYRRNDAFVSGLLLPYIQNEINNAFEDDSRLNVYRQGFQLQQVEWTPKATVVANEGTHLAGVPVHGIPYSSVKEYLKFVGIDVSLHTFMTAVNNVHSLLYTEKVGANDSQSAYGRIYKGVNSISYFGNVCSAFVTSALGLMVQYNSWEYQTMPLFKPLANQNERNLRVGDVLSEPGHCSVITKLTHFVDGSIKNIYLSEQSAYSIATPIITTIYTPRTLHERIVNSKGVYCRYNELFNNTHYKPSPFVLLAVEMLYEPDDCVFVVNGNTTKYYRCKTANRDLSFDSEKWIEINAYNSGANYVIGDFMFNTYNGKPYVFRCRVSNATSGSFVVDEWEKFITNEWASYPFTYNDDIVTFAGDRAAFKENDLIYINYNLGEYTAMELYKDEVLIQTISLSSGYQVNVSSYCSDKGFYKARLVGSGIYSRYTYFEVIETNVTANTNNNVVSVNYSSSNGKPIDLQFVKDSGFPLAHYALSDKDVANGTITVNPSMMCYAQRPEVAPYSGDAYVRVVFEGEYGNVVNEMISIGQFDTGSGIIVKPDIPLNAGEVAAASFILDGELDGKTYQLSFYAETSDVVVSVVPTIGTIYWKQSIPQTLVPGERYLVKVINGVGECI